MVETIRIVGRQTGTSADQSSKSGLARLMFRLLRRLPAIARLPEIVREIIQKLDGLERHAENQVAKFEAFEGRAEHQAATLGALERRAEHQAATLEALEGLAEHQTATLEASVARLDQLGSEARTELGRIREQVSAEAFGELRRELSAQIAFSLHDIAEQLLGGGAIKAQLDRLANEQFETKNQLIHLGTSTATQLENLATVTSETRNGTTHLYTSLHTRLNTIEHDRWGAVYEQMHDITAAMLRLRAGAEARSSGPVQNLPERYKPVQSSTLDRDLQRAGNEFPRLYPLWAERLEGMRTAALETKSGNVAHAGDSRSEAFRSFVEIHATGRVLDVGCGPFGRPFYLTSFPATLVSGIDPLDPIEPPDFEFVRGIQEYLPWPDDAFSTVISATALDHCLSLDRSLAEIRRVLCTGGRLLLWIDSVPGSPRFAPEAPDFAPADRFHLFHFDVAWFEPMLDRWFETLDRIEFRGLEFNRVMYSLRLRMAESPDRSANSPG